MVSLQSVRDLAPEEFRRWVLGGTSLALVGYAVISIVGFTQFAWSALDTSIGFSVTGVCLLGLLLALRGHEIVGVVITIAACWMEMEVGLLRTPEFPAPGMIALPVIVIAIGLLFGRRVALYATILTILVAIMAMSQSPALSVTGFTPQVAYWTTLFVIVNFAAWGLLTFGMSGFARVVRALISKEHELADTIRFAPDGILVLDGANRVLLSNPAAERILGRDHEQLAARRIDELLNESPIDDDAPGRSRCTTGESPVSWQLRGVDGKRIHVEATWRRMEGERRQLLLRDVTERVLADEQRRAIEAQLSHARRLEAVGQLAGGLAHDFNNILTAVSGSAELLRSTEGGAERESLIEEIALASDRGTALTRQLLAFARREVTQPQVIDLSERIRTMQRLLQRVAGDRQQLTFVLPADCRVRIDPGQLEQALVNLVSNARDAMPHGGRCTIAVERVRLDTGVERVRLHVIDEGIGMPDDVSARAFEPFFTTKSRGHGTGLGLASVHAMTANSNGAATIESAPGRGTRVTIDLPFVDEPVYKSNPVITAYNAPRGTHTILLAEDDDGTRSVVERMLQRAGYIVVLATDGNAAIRIIESELVHIDMLLTDVMMPGRTGPEVAERARSVRPHMPILFMTGYAEDALSELDTVAFDHGIINKPFSASGLTSRVAEVLQGATIQE